MTEKMTEKEIEREKVRENIEEIIRNSHDWLTTMKELSELQNEKVCEGKEDLYPMEIVGFEDEKEGIFIANPFLDISDFFDEIDNPIDVYGVENVKTFFHEMNEVIAQYVKQLDTTVLQWDEEKNSKEIDIYCRTMAKYELTDESIAIKDGTKLYRIRALKDFGDVKKGDLGGYVEKEENLSHGEDCWVYDNAKVYDDAEVYGNAKIYGDALIGEEATVRGNTKVYGNSWIHGIAKVYGSAMIYDSAWVYGNAKVYENAKVCENADVFGNAEVYNNAIVSEDAKIGGNAKIYGDAKVYEDAEVGGDAKVYGNAEVYGEAKIIDREVCGTMKID